MKKLLTVVLGVVLASSFVAAQTATSPKVKNVKGRFELSQDVKVGQIALKAGEYEAASKGTTLTFRKLVQDPNFRDQWNFDMKEKPIEVPCIATALPATSQGTKIGTVEAGGGLVLRSLTLDGTNVIFTFGQ